MISVTTTHPCWCDAKAGIDNTETNGHGCVPIKLFLQKEEASWIWPMVFANPSSNARKGEEQISEKD